MFCDDGIGVATNCLEGRKVIGGSHIAECGADISKKSLPPRPADRRALEELLKRGAVESQIPAKRPL